MKSFDILIIVFMGLMFIRGIFRGFLKEVFSLAGVIMGIYIGAHYHVILAVYLTWLKHPVLIKIVAFLIVFIVTYTGFSILGLILRKIFQTLFLGWLDRILGSLFGLIEGSFIVGIFLYLFHLFPLGQEVIENSEFAKRFYSIIEEIVRIFIGTGI